MLIPRLLRPALAALASGFTPVYFWPQVAMGVASLAMSAASSSAAAAAGEDAAEAQQLAWERETEMKLAAVRAQTESILAKKDEAFDSTVARMSELSRQAMIQRGRMTAVMGEAGIAGPSVSSIFTDTFRAEAAARGQEMYNLQSHNRQANRDIRGAQAGLQTAARPGDYDSTADYLNFASDAISIAGSIDWKNF